MLSLPFRRGSRVTSRGSRVNSRGSRVYGRGSRVTSRGSKNFCFVSSETKRYCFQFRVNYLHSGGNIQSELSS